LIQNVEHVEPEITTRDVAVVDEPIPETRADTGLWWLFAKPIVEEPIPETRADTGLWWLFAKPIVEEPIPETRADTGLWWLFAKPATVAIPQDNRVIIDTGIFDRPILIQNIEPVEPEVTTRNVTVTEESVPEASRVIIDTGIFDRPILIQNVEPVVEEVVPQNDRVIIDTGIFDRPILIQNVGSVEPEVTTRDIALAEEPTEETTRIIIDTGIFDRPILIQRPEEVVEVVKEMTGTVIDTGIFDRPIYIQESTNNVIENTREAPVMTTEEQQDYELRGDTSLWWLFYKQDNTNIIEIKRDVVPQQTIIQPLIRLPLAVDYLFEQPKVESISREAPVVEASKSENIIQPLIRLPLAVDYLFEQPKVESISREAPVVEAPKSENIIQPLIRLPLAVDYLFEQPKNIETPREVPVEVTYQTPNAPYGYAPQVSKPPYGVDVESVSREAPVVEAPKSENIIQPLIRLPLAVDYLFEQPKVESVSREAPVVETSKSDNIIQPLIRLPLAVDYLFEKPTDNNNTETRDVSLANIENADSEVDRLKVIIDELTAKLEQKQQSEANLNGRVATLTLMLNEADKKNRDLSRKYDEKVNNLLARTASLNTQLAVVSLLSNEPRVSNKIADDCATINELMKEKNQSKISDDCATINELMKEMEQLKQQPVETTSREVVMDAPREVVAPANNDALMAKLAQINTQLAKVSLESNDEVRNLRKIVKENEQKIDDLQKSNARINGQLANLTLNVDETIRGLKNEPSNKIANDCATINELMKEKNQSKISDDCATINELMKEMEQLKQQPVETTSREVVMDAPREVVAPANNDALMAKMAQINTQLAKLSLENNDNVRDLRRVIKEKDQKIDDLQKSNARINGQLATLTLNVDETIRGLKNEPSNKIANDCATINELMKEKNQSKISDDCATINELMKEMEQLKQQPVETTSREVVMDAPREVVAPANNDALMAKLAQINTQLAKVSLESNDEVRNLRKIVKENEQKIDDLQKSNARINGQLANLTLNVDETIRGLKNEPSNKIANDCATINELMKQMNEQPEITTRDVPVMEEVPKIANDCATIAQQNKYIAELEAQLNGNNKISDDCATINELMKEMNQSKISNDCATINELMKEMNQSKISNDCATINELMKEMKQLKQQPSESNDVEKLRNKLGELNTQVAVLSLYARDMEKANAKLEKENSEAVDSLRTKLAELNTRLAVVSLNTPSYIAPIETANEIQSREIVVPEVQSVPRAVVDVAPDMEESLRSKAADINTRLALITLMYDDDVRALKNAQKEKDVLIEDLRNKAAKLNTNLATLTLDSNEECACLREFAVEKQLERDALRSSASQLNGQLANLTLNLDEILRSNNAYLNEKTEEVDFLRQCTVQLNQQLAQLTLSFDDIIKSNNGYMAKQQDEINKLTDKTTDLNGRLARLTLNYDEMNLDNQKKIKEQAQEIEKLQQKAADLNGSIAKLTLYFDEMAQQKTTPVAPEVATREVPVVVSEVTREVPIVAPIDNESNVQSDKFRDISVKLNQNLATLTLDYDTLKRESEAQQKADQQKIEYLQNERTKLNSNLAKVTLQYDEDITKKNRTIKNLNNMLNNSNVAYNNARRGSVVAKIQKIERLTDMSTNLNSNLARVTLEFNEMVQSKDAEINKLKDSLKNYEMGNKHRNSTITVEYNDVNYYNINTNAEKHSSKVMGSSDVPTPASVPEAPEAAHIAPAAEPEIVEVKEVVVEEDGKKKKRGKRSKSTSKKIVKKSNKYGDLSIEQRKAMNKELVNQSCNIL